MVICAPLEIAHGAWDHHSSRVAINNWSKLLSVQVGLDVSVFGVTESNLIRLRLVAVLVCLFFMDLLVRQVSS